MPYKAEIKYFKKGLANGNMFIYLINTYKWNVSACEKLILLADCQGFSSTFIYIAFTDKQERNCLFPAPGRNCITHRQAIQDFPDTSQVSLHKNNKIN
jgi:hypothetical protein